MVQFGITAPVGTTRPLPSIRLIPIRCGWQEWRYTVLMMGLDFAAGSSFEIVVAGDPAAADTRAMLRALHQSFLPNKVLLFLPPGNPGPVADIAEYTATMQQLEEFTGVSVGN